MDWTPEKIDWILDGVTVGTLTNETAGTGYPQTPARISVGIWCSSCYGQAPVLGTPITDNVEDYVVTLSSLEIVNYNPASQYTFRDMSGLADSVLLTLSKPTSKLTDGVIVGIAIGGVVALVILAGVFEYWRRSRKREASPAEDFEVHELPGARTKSTEGEAYDTLAETGGRAIRYPEEEEVGGRLGPTRSQRLQRNNAYV